MRRSRFSASAVGCAFTFSLIAFALRFYEECQRIAGLPPCDGAVTRGYGAPQGRGRGRRMLNLGAGSGLKYGRRNWPISEERGWSLPDWPTRR